MSKKKSSKKSTKPKVYVLELYGDPHNSGGSVIFDVGGVSTDRSVLEKLMVVKDKELDEYFSDEPDEDDEDSDDYEYCYQNTDLSERPSWTISEYDLLK